VHLKSTCASLNQQSTTRKSAPPTPFLRTGSVPPAVTVKNPHDRTVICAIVKSEEAYLDEWINYHLGIGFSHIFIYDNSYHFDLQQWGAEQAQAGRPVTVRHHTGIAQQAAVYSQCTNQIHAANLAESVAYLDIDEFLVMRHHDHVNDFMDEHCAEGSVSLSWVHMGSNNRSTYEPLPISKRFDLRWADETDGGLGTKLYHVKTLARVKDIQLDGVFNAHYLDLKPPATRKDVHGQEFKVARKKTIDNRTDDIAAIYHFRSRSEKEYAEKFQRGRVGSQATEKDFLEATMFYAAQGWGIEVGDFPDDSVWEILKKHSPLYQVFDEPLSSAPTPVHSSNQTVGICASVNNDEAYIREWVDFHRMLGFSRFYLFDRSGNFEMQQWANETGEFVILRDASYLKIAGSEKSVRDRIMANCTALAKENGDDWLGFFDVDSFIVLKTKSHVMDMLSQYDKHDALGVYQYRFGTSNRRIYEPKPVTKRFQYRDPFIEENDYKKFIRLKYAHSPSTADIVDTDGRAMTSNNKIAERPTDVAVFHGYATKSMKEYLLTRYDFRALNVESSENDPEIWKIFGGSLPSGTVHDDEAWEAMKRMNPRYGVYDSL
jgi:hypothetical protein